MAKVTIKDVKKSYGDVDVIKGVDIEVPDGEFLVLVGPSGCGKSTLLRMVAGLEEISDGTIAIGERVVNDVKPADRDIAMVFQSYALYPHLTVLENIAFGLRLRKTPEAEEKRLVFAAAETLGLVEYLQRYPKELSGGQRQRVAMGRAIVREPSVFLFDEPLSNLDAALRGRMRIELKKLHQRLKTTMIYVTHDQVEAMTLADRIVVLKDGIVQQIGPPRELYEHPANRFVAGFIGTPEMNILAGQATRDNDGVSFVFADAVELRLPPGALPATTTEATKLFLGLRPADLDVCEAEDAQLHGTLEVIEPLGWESLLHLTIAGEPLVLMTETERVDGLKPGDSVPITFDLERLHLFDATSEVRL